MKKILAIVLLSVMLVGFSPSVKAMEVQPSQQELTQQLIQVILSLIAQLQAQMNEMIAQQNASNAAVQQESQTINQIQQNTQQIAQNTTPPPAVVVPPQSTPLTVSCSGTIDSLDNPNYEVTFTSNVSGGNGNYKYFWRGRGIPSGSDSCMVSWPSTSNMTFSDKTPTLNESTSPCPMTGNSTFIARSSGESINKYLSRVQYFYWPEKQRLSTKEDYLQSDMMTLFVKSVNEIKVVHCPLIVSN